MGTAARIPPDAGRRRGASCASASCRPRRRCRMTPTRCRTTCSSRCRKRPGSSASGTWSRRPNGAAPGSICSVRRSSPKKSSQCKMGLYIAACHAFGWDPPNAIFLGRKDQIEKYAVPTLERRRQDLRRDLGAERRLRSGPRDPDARREEGRPLHPQRHENLDLGRRPVRLGAGVRAHRRARAATASRRSSSRRSSRASATSRSR